METLTRSSSRVCSGRDRELSFLSPREVLGRPEIRFLSSPKHVSVGISHSIYLQHKRIHPICVSSLSSSSDTQKHLPNEETQTQETSKTAHVKFQLQKECTFGERFHIVGDDPMLGSWDPLNAIPLDWSEGNTWTVELDIAIGQSIQFKFILKGSTGNILWQPGPDRILQTWETKNIISVSEDWDNAELQMIIEEEPSSNEKESLKINSEMLIIAENLTQPRGGLKAEVDRESATTDTTTTPSLKPVPEEYMALVAENITDPVKQPEVDRESATTDTTTTPSLKPVPEESMALVAENITDPVKQPEVDRESATTDTTTTPSLKPVPEESMALVAENIIDPVKQPEVHTYNKAFDAKNTAYAKEEPVCGSNKDMAAGETTLGNNDRAVTLESLPGTKEEGNLGSYEGDPILVPALIPLTTVDTEETSPSEDNNTIVVNASPAAEKAEELNVPELVLEKEPSNDSPHPKDSTEMMFNDEEELHGNQQIEKPDLAKEQEQDNSNLLESNVLENNIQWGRRTLQRLLTSMGFL